MSLRSSPDIDAAALFIQRTIVVTMATAASDAMPAMASAARPEIVFSPNWITRKIATVISDCCGHSQPHPLEGVAAVGLDQERHQDRDDDCGLEALTQADQTASEQLRCDVGCGGVDTDTRKSVPAVIDLSSLRSIRALCFGCPKQGVAHLIRAATRRGTRPVTVADLVRARGTMGNDQSGFEGVRCRQCVGCGLSR